MIGEQPRLILAVLGWLILCFGAVTVLAGIGRVFLDIIGVI